MLSIDTAAISQMSSMASAAQEDINSSAGMLMKVTEHDDWNCSERDLINDQINNIRKISCVLEDVIQDFASAMRSAAGLFEEYESSIPGMCQGMELSIGSLNTLTGAFSCGGMVQAAAASAADAKIPNRFQSYEMAAASSGIHLCQFDSFKTE